jgi:hypothetical protein
MGKMEVVIPIFLTLTVEAMRGQPHALTSLPLGKVPPAHIGYETGLAVDTGEE